jgi:hypothetical protein
MRSKKRSDVERYWRKAVEDCQASGLAVKRFAEERKLAYKRLLFWKQKFQMQSESAKFLKEKPEPASRTTAPFAPIRVVDDQSEYSKQANALSTLEIVLLCGRTVRFNNRCRPEYLSSVVSVLEGC